MVLETEFLWKFRSPHWTREDWRGPFPILPQAIGLRSLNRTSKTRGEVNFSSCLMQMNSPQLYWRACCKRRNMVDFLLPFPACLLLAHLHERALSSMTSMTATVLFTDPYTRTQSREQQDKKDYKSGSCKKLPLQGERGRCYYTKCVV
ncbi:hypothetical protein Y1Q_0001086 [Alligator mississippiensis]|uniref:Uncharacterized protein n=1 Tax=Alligator mississippiensis TaxID=8496 RepID=A0A151NEG1_ALLMI|nr:hypothetical protein Y1Q_0001086 [Alligator mississippiensis]